MKTLVCLSLLILSFFSFASECSFQMTNSPQSFSAGNAEFKMAFPEGWGKLTFTKMGLSVQGQSVYPLTGSHHYAKSRMRLSMMVNQSLIKSDKIDKRIEKAISPRGERPARYTLKEEVVNKDGVKAFILASTKEKPLKYALFVPNSKGDYRNFDLSLSFSSQTDKSCQEETHTLIQGMLKSIEVL